MANSRWWSKKHHDNCMVVSWTEPGPGAWGLGMAARAIEFEAKVEQVVVS